MKKLWKSLLCGFAVAAIVLPTGCAKQAPVNVPGYSFESNDPTYSYESDAPAHDHEQDEPTYHYALKDVTLDERALYNGIVIPEDWSFVFKNEDGSRITAPYLIDGSGYTAEYINIDKGRQLFVDDFLIDSTTLTQEYKQAITRTEPLFEKGPVGSAAVLTSGGVWYDMDEQIYKMWYQMDFAS